MKVLHKSAQNLQQPLANPKNKLETYEQSRIYEIRSSNNCDANQVGHTRPAVLISFKEYMAHLRYTRKQKIASVVQSAIGNNHTIDKKCMIG